jgi:ankyrin repeat protein
MELATWRVACGPAECDQFVVAAHDDPAAALGMLCRNPDLAYARSSWGETGLQAASHLGHRRLIHALIDHGAGLDVFAACALGLRRAARRLLDGVHADACGVHDLPILHFAIVSTDLGMVRMLVDAGVAVNPRKASLSPLHSAVATGSLPAVRLLLVAGADPTVRDALGATAIDWAIAMDLPPAMVKDLLEERRRFMTGSAFDELPRSA